MQGGVLVTDVKFEAEKWAILRILKYFKTMKSKLILTCSDLNRLER